VKKPTFQGTSPCECGKVYVGQKGRSIETRCKEHRRHIHIEQPDMSAVVEHSINTGHHIDFSDTIVFDSTLSYVEHLVKEAICIQLNNINLSRDSDLMLSRAWHPVINICYPIRKLVTQQALEKTNSSLWLVHHREHGTRADICMTRTGSPDTLTP
jgi:hypothetical protein